MKVYNAVTLKQKNLTFFYKKDLHCNKKIKMLNNFSDI